MGFQSSINQALVSTAAMAHTAGKLKKDSTDIKMPSTSDAKAEAQVNIDQKMARRARDTARAKLQAITENKQLSNRARTRRMNNVLKAYDQDMRGGK